MIRQERRGPTWMKDTPDTCTAAAACSDPAAPEDCTLGGFADGETTVHEAPLGA